MILNSPYITGSATITGNLNVNGTISGTISGTSSYADNANLLDGRDSLTFANTGSNSFVGQQNINGAVAVTGSLTTTGVITAQSINVQQVTSSIVYSSGSNVFGNSVSNIQSMTGSVGITGSLSVNGAATFSNGIITTATSAAIGLELRARASDDFSQINFTNNAGSNINSSIGVEKVGTNGGLIYFYTKPDGGSIAERMRITSAGNVGIGTTPTSGWGSDSKALQIGIKSSFADISASGDTHINNNCYWDGSQWKYLTSSNAGNIYISDSNIGFRRASAGTAGNNISWNTSMLITSGGNVGIGTASPQLNTNSGTFLTVQGTNANGWLELATTSTTDGNGGAITFNNTNVVGSDKRVAQITSGREGANNSGNLSFATWNAGSSGTRLTISASGAATFTGALTMSAYSFASSAIQFTRAASNLVTPASGNGILVFAGGNAQMRMDTANQICFDMNNGGNPHTVLTLKQSDNTVSINSPNNNLPLELKYQNVASGYLGAFGSALYAYSTNGGYVLLNASSVFVAASDAKRKRNFETYSNGLASILGLQPKLYNMDFQEDGDEKQVGLIAQEVKEFIPKAYNENGDFIGLDYNAIIVTMVNAIQEQQAQIEELKAEIDLLKNK